ncbi:MAG: UDP-galactopyranose mutase [Alistipes sp.]
MKAKYDYLVVGAGLYGAVFAYRAAKQGKQVLVIDRRDHLGGNIYCDTIEDIHVHRYGAHIFHTSNRKVWEFVNQFVSFNRYTNSPVANYKGKLYNLPFNMNTFYAMWGVKTPAEAAARIEEQRHSAGIREPRNLEEQAIALIGRDLYQTLIKGYTEKQWGRDAASLPAFIIKRLPVRFTFDNNYFNDPYQGIPIGGYNPLIEKLLAGIDTRCNADFCAERAKWEAMCDKIVFTGRIDEYYDYCLGELEYRSLRFDTKVMDCANYQGNAVMNYTEREVPYTRVIEHKHFEFGTQPRSVVTYEYPDTYDRTKDPYYSVNDERNTTLYLKYKALADIDPKVIFGGRLGEYRYYDMDKVIEQALKIKIDA